MKTLALLLFALQVASAGTVFFDDFESGSLNPVRWANPGTGFVTGDPTGNLNKVLTFGATSSGGDVFGILIPNLVGTYQLDFNFYEADSAVPDPANIGYIGTDHQTNLPAGPDELWVWNARDNAVEVGKWNHISLTITPLTSAPFNLKLEVAGTSPGDPLSFGVFFDDITLNEAPEPSTLWLVGCVALSLLVRRRLSKSGKPAAWRAAP